MGYSNSEEKEIIRLEKNSKGDYIVVKEIGEFVDIRQYYTSDSGEVLPTKKGVRFNAELLTDIIGALLDEYDDVATDVLNNIEN